MTDPMVSVIVPVFGVEPFIEKCARALMEQTLRHDVEFIFVDDASPDRSLEILHRVISGYPDRARQVSILRHTSNRGLPSARNTGMDAARSMYILHLDSDDFPDPDMIETLLWEAVRTDADMVWCDFYLSGENSMRIMPQPKAVSPTHALGAMLGGAMKYNVWNKLTRRSIFYDNALRFPDGDAMGEDMTMIMAAACCRSVSSVDRPLYHYRRSNAGAMTRAYDDTHLCQLRRNVDRISGFILNRRPDMEAELDFFKLQVKYPFLLMRPFRRGFRLWNRWWPESNRRIGSNRHMTAHSRLAQRLAALHLWPLVWIYAEAVTLYQKCRLKWSKP